MLERRFQTRKGLSFMKIRVAQKTDAPQISQLLIDSANQFFANDFSVTGLAKFKADFTEQRISERLESHEFSYYVTEQVGEIIAVCAIRNDKHLYNLFTRADYQRQGIAKLLWHHVTEELKRENVSIVTVNASNYAVPAYEKLGFVRVGEMQVFEDISFNPMVNDLRVS